jgi:hypothetical protein
MIVVLPVLLLPAVSLLLLGRVAVVLRVVDSRCPVDRVGRDLVVHPWLGGNDEAGRLSKHGVARSRVAPGKVFTIEIPCLHVAI